MLFRAPGKSNNFDYSSNVHFQPVNQTNQRSMCTFNNSFTVLQKCSSQQKVGRNYEQRFTNFPNHNFNAKTQPQMAFEDQKYKQTVVFKPPTYTDLGKGYMNYNPMPLEQQCLILRKQKSQFSQKMKRAEQQIQTKQNIIRGKQKEIEELKLIHMQSQGPKPQSDQVSQLRSQKQKLYFQVIQLQTEIHKLQEKYEKMQREHYGLTQKYDELTNKSSLQMNRKMSKQQLLQSELSLSQKRNQRLKTEYEKQINNLKEKLRENQNQSRLYNNKSTVISYNQSSFSDNYASTKSQPELQNSRIQIQKYQSEIRQKNQMIRYLEMQCLRDKKKDAPQNDTNKINSLYEQAKKQLAKALKQGEAMKRQIASLISKNNSSDKMRQDLIKQIKDLEYLLKQVRDKLCKTMEQNRTINKRQRENNQKLGERIQQQQTQLLKSSSKFRQEMEETQRAYEKMLSELRQKSNAQLKIKDEQIKNYSIEKQELMLKVTEYQNLLKQNSAIAEKLANQLKQVSNQKQSVQNKIAEELDQNTQRLQKQLKIKTQQLFISDSTIISLQKQVHSVKRSLEVKINELTCLVTKFEEEKRKYEQQLRMIDAENKKLRSEKEESAIKSGQSTETLKNENKKLELQLKELESNNKKEQQRHENLINYLKQQQRKLRGIIGDHQRDNLNLTISIENQKQRHFETNQKLKASKQEKKQLKKQIEELRLKSLQLQQSVAKVEALQKLEIQKGLLIQSNKELTAQLQKLNLKINQRQNKNTALDQNYKLLRKQNEKIAQMSAETLQEKEKYISELKVRAQGLQKECEKFRHDIQLQKKESSRVSSVVLKQTEELDKKQQKLFQIQSELAAVRARAQNLQKGANQNEKALQQMVKTLQNRQDLIKDLQQKVKQLSIEIQAKTQQSNDESLKFQQLVKAIQQKQSLITKLSQVVKAQQNKTAQSEKQMVKSIENNKKLEAKIKQLQDQVNTLKIESVQSLQTIENLKCVIKQGEYLQSEHRKSLQQKDRYNKQIEQSLEELTLQLEQIKLKFMESQLQNQKIKAPAEQEQKGLTVSKMSALSSESFIADLIEIDRNALLHICDLLGVEPQDGEILKTIIQFIEGSNYITINEQYREILELFGVETQINQKTQEVLIGEIKSFRQTMMNLVQKTSILQMRNENLSKDNHRLSKQLNKLQFKDSRSHLVSLMIDDLNTEILKSKLSAMNTKLAPTQALQP